MLVCSVSPSEFKFVRLFKEPNMTTTEKNWNYDIYYWIYRDDKRRFGCARHRLLRVTQHTVPHMPHTPFRFVVVVIDSFCHPLCVNRLDRWAVDHFCSVFHNPFCHSLRRLHFRRMKMTDDVSDGTHSHHLTHVINAMNEHLSRIHSRPGHSGLNEKRPSKAVWMTVSL